MRLTQHSTHSFLSTLFAVVNEAVVTMPERRLQGFCAAIVALHQHGEVLVRITSNPLHGMAVETVWVNVLASLLLPASLHFTIADDRVLQSLRQVVWWPVWLSLLCQAIGQSLEHWLSDRQNKLICLFHFNIQQDGLLLSLHLWSSQRRTRKELEEALADG